MSPLSGASDGLRTDEAGPGDPASASSAPTTLLPGVGLTVAAVARRLGIAPATLRTWDRRYGLGPSERSAGSHRRYDGADLARLEHMRRLVLSGVAPAEAARAVRDIPDPQAATPPSGPATEAPAGRAGGGRVVAIPGGTPAARGLARAALALDSGACEQIIVETLDRRGVVWTWDHLIAPVLVGVGQRWEQSGVGIDVEHVLSEAVQAVLSGVVRRGFTPISPRPVLLAGADGEAHTLPLWAVAAGLAELRIESRMMGARTPADALAAAVRRIGPAAVLLWSQTSDTGDPACLDALPDLRPGPQILLAGPGWAPGPTEAHRVSDLSGALAALARAVGS